MFLLWLTHLPALGVRQIAQSARLFSPAMNALGPSRHFDRAPITSGLPLRTDIDCIGRHVSKVPWIGIGGSLAAPPLPHHRTYGSVYGGSRSCANTLQTGME